MIRILWRLILWMRGGSLKLLTLAAVILLAWGMFAPVGTLVWWLNEGGEKLGFENVVPVKLIYGNYNSDNTNKRNCYIVFLSGIGDFSADELTPGESIFLENLAQNHSDCGVVSDVFPYSASNKGLKTKRLLTPLWEFAYNADGWLHIADILIQIRNLWRFAISADERYGTVYNKGIASAIIERINAQNSISSSNDEPLNIILIGYSGGAEVSLGAAYYLNNWLNTKITVVSIGGVFNGRNGFESIEHFYHIRGEQDWIEDIGGIVFPSRWLWNLTSSYNQARLEGRYTAITSPLHTHTDSKGYFDLELVPGKNINYVDLTIQQVNELPIWRSKSVISNQ